MKQLLPQSQRSQYDHCVMYPHHNRPASVYRNCWNWSLANRKRTGREVWARHLPPAIFFCSWYMFGQANTILEFG